MDLIRFEIYAQLGIFWRFPNLKSNNFIPIESDYLTMIHSSGTIYFWGGKQKAQRIKKTKKTISFLLVSLECISNIALCKKSQNAIGVNDREKGRDHWPAQGPQLEEQIMECMSAIQSRVAATPVRGLEGGGGNGEKVASGGRGICDGKSGQKEVRGRWRRCKVSQLQILITSPKTKYVKNNIPGF